MTRDQKDDDAMLDALFARTRAEEPAPSTALLSAILGDAAEVSAGRAAVSAPLPERAAPRRRFGIGAALEAIGGWGGMTVLGTCAAVGFWFGTVDMNSYGLETGGLTQISQSETSVDQVTGFFDMASVEG